MSVLIQCGSSFASTVLQPWVCHFSGREWSDSSGYFRAPRMGASNYNHVPKVSKWRKHWLSLMNHVHTRMPSYTWAWYSNAFILHQALAAKCPSALVKALVQTFSNQVQQKYIDARFPLHIALRSGLGALVQLLASMYPASHKQCWLAIQSLATYQSNKHWWM
jgi:hypothetical protein